MGRINTDGEKKNILVSLVRSSIILTAIDRFTVYIYSLLKNGLFGFIFSGYKNESRSVICEKIVSTKLSHHLGELRYGLCRQIEQSLIVGLIDKFAKYLLKCRLKVYGTFFISLGVYTALTVLVDAITADKRGQLIESTAFTVSLVLIVASLPLILSKNNLAQALTGSKIGKAVIRITGFNSDSAAFSATGAGHSSVSFILGVIIAILSHEIAPSTGIVCVLGGIAAAVFLYIVLLRPEFGVCMMFFLIPFLPTMVLAGFVIYTFFCLSVKIFRGKRVLRVEPIDIVVAVFALLLLSGGLISLSPGSLKPSLLMVCLILGYFLTVQLMRDREWLVRSSTAIVVSAAIVSLYGIIAYYTGAGYYSSAWLDDEMFSSISNRAVSTLENPNMLGEYLLIVIPIALAMFIGKEGLRKMPTFFCLVSLGACLLLTWSRGAWLSLIVALIIFILMWHHRSLCLVILGVCSLPVLPSVLPASVMSRLSSIGNMADSSTSYRVYIWRASVNMIKDNAVAGIGIGESAWRRLYPLYSYMGIEAAPHSHNLFIQIWLELGVFGIIAFALFIFMLIQAALTLFRRLSSKSSLTTPELSEDMIRYNKQRGLSTLGAQRLSKIQLRISVIGPLTGIIAVLVQGITDYSWYNYRLYLFFWMVAGLCVAYVRNGNSFLAENRSLDHDESSSDAKILVRKTRKPKRKNMGKQNERA